MDSELDGIPEWELQQLTGAHRTTAHRWRQRARRGLVPVWLQTLVSTVCRGRLDAIHRDWRGWIINKRDGELVTPEGVCVTQGKIRALPQLYELRRALEGELLRLRAELERRPQLATCAAGRRRPLTAQRANDQVAAAQDARQDQRRA